MLTGGFRLALRMTMMLCAVLCAAGCAQQPVAVVDGRAIEQKTFDRHLKEKVAEHRLQKVQPDMKRLRLSVLNQLIIERMLLDDASKKGISVPADEVETEMNAVKRSMGDGPFEQYLRDRGYDIGTYRQATRDRLIIGRFRQSLSQEDPVTEDEMRDYYRNSPKPFVTQPRSLVKMIEIYSEDAARAAAREMLRDKVDFDVMAARLAAEGKATVIEYGWVRPGYFSPELAQAIMNLRVGQFGGPYRGRKDFFLVRVKDREKEKVAGYDEVKGQIMTALREEKNETVFSRWLEGKKQTASIRVNLK